MISPNDPESPLKWFSLRKSDLEFHIVENEAITRMAYALGLNLIPVAFALIVNVLRYIKSKEQGESPKASLMQIFMAIVLTTTIPALYHFFTVVPELQNSFNNCKEHLAFLKKHIKFVIKTK
jgi:predicted metal-binding membrane protein